MILFFLIILFECGLLTIIHETGVEDISNALVFTLILFFSMFFIAYIFNNNKHRKLKMFLLYGYIIRLMLVFIDIFGRDFFILPNSGSDSEMFYWNAVNVSQGGITIRGLYPQVMGDIFRFIGINRLYGQFLSMLCSIVALVFLLYSLEKLEIDEVIKEKIYSITCFLPNVAILGSLFIREAVIWMFLSMSLYLFTLWITEKKSIFFFISLLLVLPAAAFHSGLIGVAVGYIAIRLIYDNNNETIHLRFSNVVLTVLFIFMSVFVITNTGDRFIGKFTKVDSIEDIANTNDMGGSSYARYVGNSSNPANLIVFTPLRILFFLFSPFPWQWRNISDVIAFLFSAMYYYVSFRSAIRFLKTRYHKNRAILIVFCVIALTTVFIFAWGTSNTGTATRHRDKLFMLFALIWAISLDGRQRVLMSDFE